LVCEVAYAEWTEDEQLRQTTFLGWRDDKNAKQVTQRRASLREIGDLLRHRRPDTTAIYAKVD
jgi:ATP-dependent DNA ligase